MRYFGRSLGTSFAGKVVRNYMILCRILSPDSTNGYVPDFPCKTADYGQLLSDLVAMVEQESGHNRPKSTGT